MVTRNTVEEIRNRLQQLGCSKRQIDRHLNQLRASKEVRAWNEWEDIQEQEHQPLSCKQSELVQHKTEKRIGSTDKVPGFTGLDPNDPHSQRPGTDMRKVPWE
jgi:hypothetical protein